MAAFPIPKTWWKNGTGMVSTVYPTTTWMSSSEKATKLIQIKQVLKSRHAHHNCIPSSCIVWAECSTWNLDSNPHHGSKQLPVAVKSLWSKTPRPCIATFPFCEQVGSNIEGFYILQAAFVSSLHNTLHVLHGPRSCKQLKHPFPASCLLDPPKMLLLLHPKPCPGVISSFDFGPTQVTRLRCFGRFCGKAE